MKKWKAVAVFALAGSLFASPALAQVLSAKSANTIFLKTITKIKMVFKILAKYPGGDQMDLEEAGRQLLLKGTSFNRL